MEFTLTHRMQQGKAEAPGISRYQRELRVDALERTVRYEIFRDDLDTQGAAIGLYGMPLTFETAAELANRCAGLRDVELEHFKGMDVMTPIISITAKALSLECNWLLTPSDRVNLDKMAPLLDLLEEIKAKVLKHPLGVLQTQLELRQEPGGGTFVAHYRNLGSEPLVLTHPLSSSVVAFGEYPFWDNYPPEVTWISIPFAKKIGPAEVVLPAESEIAVETIRWRHRDLGKRYLAKLVWGDYQGPGEVDGHHRLRGGHSGKSIYINPQGN